MNPSPTPQQHYDQVQIPQAALAHSQLSAMQSLLRQEMQKATAAGNMPKVAEITKALQKNASGHHAGPIISLLNDVAQQQGKWRISPNRSLTERSDDAGELMSDAGQLGYEWLLLLTSYQVPGLPENPIFNCKPLQ